jgi:D-xylose transport system substrate-binding protein
LQEQSSNNSSQQAGGKLDAVVSANEGLGLAAVAVLKKNNLNGKTCVSGQDASAAGLAAILTGDLSNTVYKPISQEANAAAALAISLVKGTKAATNGFTAVTGWERVTFHLFY